MTFGAMLRHCWHCLTRFKCSRCRRQFPFFYGPCPFCNHAVPFVDFASVGTRRENQSTQPWAATFLLRIYILLSFGIAAKALLATDGAPSGCLTRAMLAVSYLGIGGILTWWLASPKILRRLHQNITWAGKTALALNYFAAAICLQDSTANLWAKSVVVALLGCVTFLAINGFRPVQTERDVQIGHDAESDLHALRRWDFDAGDRDRN